MRLPRILAVSWAVRRSRIVSGHQGKDRVLHRLQAFRHAGIAAVVGVVLLDQPPERLAHLIGGSSLRVKAEHHPGPEVLQNVDAVDHGGAVLQVPLVGRNADEAPIEHQPVFFGFQGHLFPRHRELEVLVLAQLGDGLAVEVGQHLLLELGGGGGLGLGWWRIFERASVDRLREGQQIGFAQLRLAQERLDQRPHLSQRQLLASGGHRPVLVRGFMLASGVRRCLET